MAAVKSKSVKNQYRLDLQEQLRGIANLRAEMVRSSEALEVARRLVEEGEKPPRYAEKFNEDVLRQQAHINKISSEIPRMLLSSCQDEALKQNWEESRVLRAKAATALAAEDQALQLIHERIAGLRGRISQKRGRPDILEGSQRPRWSDDVRWAICGDEIHFPADDRNADEYKSQWSILMREQRLANAARNDANDRYVATMKNYEAARQAMIDSPI